MSYVESPEKQIRRECFLFITEDNYVVLCHESLYIIDKQEAKNLNRESSQNSITKQLQ